MYYFREPVYLIYLILYIFTSFLHFIFNNLLLFLCIIIIICYYLFYYLLFIFEKVYFDEYCFDFYKIKYTQTME